MRVVSGSACRYGSISQGSAVQVYIFKCDRKR